MVSILFVCYGNICRSPMAVFVMKDLVKCAGREEEFLIRSEATTDDEAGNPVYPPAKRELAQHGISCEGKVAVRLRTADYAKYDFIIGMEERNVRDILSIVRGDPEGKVKKLLDFTARGGDIADPWFTRRFDVTYRQVSEGCAALLNYLLER